MKNLRLLSSSFFRALRHGVLRFLVDAFFTEKIAKQNRMFWLFFRLPTTLEGPGAMNMASKNTVPKNPEVSKPQIKNNKETFDNKIHIVAVLIASKSAKTHLAAKKCCGCHMTFSSFLRNILRTKYINLYMKQFILITSRNLHKLLSFLQF